MGTRGLRGLARFRVAVHFHNWYILLLRTAIPVLYHYPICLQEEKNLAIYRKGIRLLVSISKNSRKPLQILPFDQQSLLSAAFLESLLLLLCHAFAFVSFSSALLSANSAALMPRIG